MKRVVTLVVGCFALGSVSASASKLPHPYHLLSCSAGGGVISYELPAGIGGSETLHGANKKTEELHTKLVRSENTGKLQLEIVGAGPAVRKYKNLLSLETPKNLKPSRLDKAQSQKNQSVIEALKWRGYKLEDGDANFKCYTRLDARVQGLSANLTCMVCTNYVSDLQTVINGGAMTIAPGPDSEAEEVEITR